jgi:cation-transporting ATPase 13A2
LESVASCHSITYVNGELIGDPLDVKMFEATNWVLDEPSNDAKIDELVLAYVRPPFAGK